MLFGDQNKIASAGNDVAAASDVWIRDSAGLRNEHPRYGPGSGAGRPHVARPGGRAWQAGRGCAWARGSDAPLGGRAWAGPGPRPAFRGFPPAGQARHAAARDGCARPCCSPRGMSSAWPRRDEVLRRTVPGGQDGAAGVRRGRPARPRRPGPRAGPPRQGRREARGVLAREPPSPTGSNSISSSCSGPPKAGSPMSSQGP